MSANGSPSTTSRSASLPGTSDPVLSSTRKALAAPLVAATMVASGERPPSTISCSSMAFNPCG